MSGENITLQDIQSLQIALKIRGVVQKYAWGKVGRCSRVARFVTDVSPDERLAEYWLGVHERGSARVVLPEGTLCNLASILPQDKPLQFLLKVLSIDEALGLSIQSHPDKALARRLHESLPEHYPDINHKPELGVALSPVEILYGFKPVADISALLDLLPMARSVFPQSVASDLAQCSRDANGELLKRIFSSVLRADSLLVSNVVREIVATEPGICAERDIIARLSKAHGESDPGLIAVMLMNLVPLAEGEGIFIAPNVPHAYLSGDLIECMACSDNVIRAGLTQKYCDIDTLIATCAYDSIGMPPLTLQTLQDSGVFKFEVPVDDFELGVVPTGKSATLFDSSRHRILLSVDGISEVCNHESGATITLADGEAALLVADSGGYECRCASGRVFIAS
jgi:mannose-6-phosphate isomerase